MAEAIMVKRWLAFGFVLFLAACGGGGGGSSSAPSVPVATPTPTAAPTTAPVSVPAGATATTAPLGTIAGGYTGALSLPAAASGAGTFAASLSATAPSGSPALQSFSRQPRAIGGASLSALFYVTVTPSATVTFASSPTFTVTLPAGVSLAAGTLAYVALFDPSRTPVEWQNYLGPGTITGQQLTFTPSGRSVTFSANTTYVFVVFTTTTVLSFPTPSPTPFNGPSPVSATTAVPTTGTLVANLPSIATGFGGSLNAQGVSAPFATAITATISLGPLPSVAGQPAITAFAAPNQVLVYGDFVVNNSFGLQGVTVGNTTLTFTFPPGTLTNTPYYFAIWPGNASNPQWISTSGTPALPFPVSNTDFGPGQTITLQGTPTFNFGNDFVYGFAVYR